MKRLTYHLLSLAALLIAITALLQTDVMTHLGIWSTSDQPEKGTEQIDPVQS